VENSGSLEALRELNRRRVVDALRRQGTASRSDLGRQTGLSRTTIASLVSDLKESGLVVEDTSETQPVGRGRPPARLRFDPSAGVAVGIHFDHHRLVVALADLSSRVLAEQAVDLDVDHAAETALDAAADLVDDVLSEARIDRSRVIGAGAALAGPIGHDGTVGATAIMPSWVGLDAAEELQRRLELPTSFDNDANLGALAEVSFGAGRGLADVIYVMISSGVGAGIVLGGRVHRGATGFAGELGHVFVRSGGALCRCGNRGCLETVASTDALLDLLRPSYGDALDVQGLVDLVVAGDPGARRVVGDAGREIGRVIAGACNMLNPAGVIVGGDLGPVGGPLLTGIRDSLDRYALPTVVEALDVRAGVLGERAEVLGALALVIGNAERLRPIGLRRERDLARQVDR
jgi:predicted NBD/HSP70 family sugar kinase